MTELVAIEEPTTRRFVAPHHLATWGVSFAEAQAVATRNLSENLPRPQRDSAGGWRFEAPGAAGLLRLPGWAHAFGSASRLAVPTPDAVWVIAANGDDLSAWIAAVGAAFDSAGTPLSPAVLLPDLTAWTDHPAALWALQRLAGLEYAAQEADDAELLPLRLVRRGAHSWTEVVWDGKSDAWLPEVDRVVLPDGPRPWAEVVGRLRPAGTTPPRWRLGQCGSGRSSRPEG